MLDSRRLSLRAAKSRECEDQLAREVVRFKLEEIQRKEKSKQEAEERSRLETELLFSKVPLEPSDIGDEIEEAEGSEEDDSSDSDWEDTEEIPEEPRQYNTMSLKNLSRECDRYGVSDRAGAKLGNGLLKDLGIVKRGSTRMLICPQKLERERKKWGAQLEKEHSEVELPQGLYTDGKRVPTLVRQTTATKVQVPGGRGRGAHRIVVSTSNKVIVEDHYPVVAEPNGEYVTHVTPADGTGLSLAKELVNVMKEKKTNTKYSVFFIFIPMFIMILFRVMGMDGCPVNTGIHNGAMRLVEVLTGDVVQHVVCGLHLNELLFWHVLAETDGVTKGPGVYTSYSPRGIYMFLF